MKSSHNDSCTQIKQLKQTINLIKQVVDMVVTIILKQQAIINMSLQSYLDDVQTAAPQDFSHCISASCSLFNYRVLDNHITFSLKNKIPHLLKENKLHAKVLTHECN